MSEADEIPMEELNGADEILTVLESEGWEGWAKRQADAVAWLASNPRSF